MKELSYFILQNNISNGEEPILVKTSYRCQESDFDSSYSSALEEAYNGEVTVEDIPMTAEEARAQRDKLLADTDWTQVLDSPIDADTREAYRAYRQALRDIPEQEGFPHSITWPEPPVKVKAAPDPVDEAVDLLLSGATGKEATE